VKRANRYAWLIGLSVIFSAGVAAASGFYVARFGGEHGHPTTDSLTSMYYNPAGLSLGTGTRLYLDGNFAWRNFTYERPVDAIDHILEEGENAPGTPERAVAANSGTASLNNKLASPFIGVASDFGIKGLGVGLSLYAPFGGSSVYDKQDAVEGFPGATDGPQRWWAIEGTIKNVYITGTAAYHIPELRLALGLSVNMVRSEVNTARARNASGHDHLSANDDGALLEGRALLDVKATELSIGLGLIWEPIDKFWIGLSYQSSPSFGESELEGNARLVIGNGDETQPKVKFFQSLPDVYHFGTRWRANEKFELRVFGNYIRWSSFDEQCALDLASPETCDGNPLFLAPRNWDDGYAVRLGGSYWLTEDIEFVAGGGYDTNAVPDSTVEPALFDTDKYTASAGARLEFMEDSLALGVSYTQVIYNDRDVKSRGRTDAMNETDIDQFGFRQGQRQPDSSGVYTQAVGVLNVNLEYSF
jgi:long-chain fatty acid transport protein